ncbi:MAG TPA: sugar ABC transporter permease [Ktedonobacteraceae bacterium]|jgi:ABC-type sugar transport system permease subunit|nr:sugar ABC transporter permease [Ktedonobacteraceae bacterium]
MREIAIHNDTGVALQRGTQVHSARKGRQKRTKQQRQEILAAYLFLAPALVLFIVFIAAPFLGAFGLSLFSWDMFTAPQFVGLANYAKLLTDTSARTALWNTAVFTFWSLVLHLGVGMLLALAVNRAIAGALKYFLRTAYFFPLIMSWAAVALMWLYLLDPNFGIVNYYLGKLGLPTPNWLVTSSLALPALIFVDLWRTLGFTFIILLAGLTSVPTHFYEAARLDGAGAWRRFWNITLPLMSPTLLFACIITVVGAFQIFDPMFVMTRGGPGTSTLSIVLYIYETGFQSFQMGYASTLALVVFIAIMILTIIQLSISRYWVHYD